MIVATPDPQFDLSLRFLSLVVSGAIIAALLWYLVLLLQPLAHFGDGAEMGPPAWAATPELPTTIASAPPATTDTDGGGARFTVFRCVVDGSVTYTDRPCERGELRVLRLPRR